MKPHEGALASAPPAAVATAPRVFVGAGSSQIHTPPRSHAARAANPRRCVPPLTNVLEEQARRIAHALHDDAGQLLTAIALGIDRVAREFPEVAPRLHSLGKLITRLDDQLRSVAYELRPAVLDDLGLSAALQCLVDRLLETGLSITLDVALPVWLPPAIVIAVYRMVQGALTNVARHAAATHVVIDVHAADGVVHCSIEDDGRGFDVRAVQQCRQRGLGLLGMQEHVEAAGGSLWITSSPGEGTKLVASIPLEIPDADQRRARR